MLKSIFAVICGLLMAVSTAHSQEFSLISKTIEPNTYLTENQLFNGFGCTGKNISPDLTWTPGPKGTLSYAVTVYDPDAPTGSGWWHWVVYNIPGNINELPPGAGNESGEMLPEGAVQGRTDYGTNSFGGACPPVGDKAHRYIFTVYALKTEKIELPKDASAALIGFMIHANKLASASFTALYGR